MKIGKCKNLWSTIHPLTVLHLSWSPFDIFHWFIAWWGKIWDLGFGGEELFKPIIAIFSALKGHPADQSTNQLELFYPQSYLDNSVYHSGLVLFKLSLLCSCFWPVLHQLDFTFPHWTPQRQLNSLFYKILPISEQGQRDGMI